LRPTSQVLSRQIIPTTHCGSYRSEDNSQPLKHVARLTDLSEKPQQNQDGRTNGRDTDADAGRCDAAAETLEKQYPSLRGEVIEYIENRNLIDAVLLVHCNAIIGKHMDADRLIAALWDIGMLSDSALQADKTLRIVRVALHAVAGNVDSAISDLVAIDKNAMTLGIAEIILPILLPLPRFCCAALTDL